MILIGTSGWSYDDWVGPVYPASLGKGDWLPYLANQVDTLEVNVTYYRIPPARTAQGWVARTPDDFVLSVKAHKSITHERKSPQFGAFRDGVAPLVESEKLASVLAQFPYSFHATSQNYDYLFRLREGLGDLPVVVEFRHRDWIEQETFDLLEELRFGFCSVDEPQLKNLLPPVVRAMAPVAYVRFHGRTGEKWWNHDHAWERYDYNYSEEELSEWVPQAGAARCGDGDYPSLRQQSLPGAKSRRCAQAERSARHGLKARRVDEVGLVGHVAST